MSDAERVAGSARGNHRVVPDARVMVATAAGQRVQRDHAPDPALITEPPARTLKNETEHEDVLRACLRKKKSMRVSKRAKRRLIAVAIALGLVVCGVTGWRLVRKVTAASPVGRGSYRGDVGI